MKMKRIKLEQEFEDDPSCVWEHPNGWNIVKDVATNVGIRGGSITSYIVFQGDELPKRYGGPRKYEFSTLTNARAACDAAENGCWDCLRQQWSDMEVTKW